MSKTLQKCVYFLTAAAMVTMLAVPAFADEFKPSVTAAGSGVQVGVLNQAGHSVGAVINGVNGAEVGSVGMEDVTFTTVLDVPTEEMDAIVEETGADVTLPKPNEGWKAQEEKQAAARQLARAFRQVLSIKSLTDLSADFAEILSNVFPHSKLENMVVKDIFDVSIPKDIMDEMKANGGSVQLAFKCGVPVESTLMVLHNYEGDRWETIAPELVERQEDGTVLVTFSSLSPIAFVVDKTQAVLPEIESPFTPVDPTMGQEANAFPVGVILAVVVLAAAGITVGVVMTTRKSKRHHR